MQPINNSDLAWLIMADFLADQNKIAESEKLRESINNPETDTWDREYNGLDCVGGSVGGLGVSVGTVDFGSGNMVGSRFSSRVGGGIGIIDGVGGAGINGVGCRDSDV